MRRTAPAAVMDGLAHESPSLAATETAKPHPRPGSLDLTPLRAAKLNRDVTITRWPMSSGTGMAIRCTATCALLLANLVAGLALADAVPKGRKVDFDKSIRPIFTKHCTACHGGVKQAADLSFVYGDSADYTIEPGDPEASYLIERVDTEEAEYRMPPPDHGPKLSDEEIVLLRRWIAEGGQWEVQWSYRQPRRHPQPSVTKREWPRQPIDAFVLSKLESLGIEPAPDESAERWLRRVSLDLIGLPPTLEERADFLEAIQTAGEDAYAAVVDRLLADPGVGERWASVWFDQVRYADSRGQGEDSPRDIWKYRDWVIDALNDDLPYDQFTIKQLAGDLLPDGTLEDRLATAAHRLTQTNEEGGTDDEEFRVASVLDRVSTVWQAWQGTTIGCVQCHSHPYDPIQHEEYYRSVAFFNNTVDCDLSDDWPLLEVPLDPADYTLADELDRRIDELQESLWRQQYTATRQQASWRPLRMESVESSNATKIVIEKKESHDEYRTVGTIARHPEFSLRLLLPDGVERVTGVKLVLNPLDPEKALPDAEVGFVLSQVRIGLRRAGEKEVTNVKLREVIGDEPFPYSDPNESLRDNKHGFGAYTRVNHPREAVLIPETPLDVAPGATLVVRLKHRIFDLAAFSLVARSGSVAITSDEAITQTAADDEAAKAKKRLAALRAARAEIESVGTPILRERPEHLARPTHLFVRGLFLTKGGEVKPGVPVSMTASDDQPRDRLGFAQWIVSEENALTARVAVNRFWARLFGIGLVSTEEDFGAAGDRPSHPDLLDDLAVRFREDYGWSIKRLLRELTLSRAYRQSSRVRPELYERDTLNRLIARGPRHSLPAETVRDQMLAISGLLSEKMHGPPVQPPLPSGVWKARRGSWKTPPKDNPDRYRRSVYTYIKRSVPFPTFAVFDAPSRDYCVPKRLRSNTPLQPLMLLNDTTYVECAVALAEEMARQSTELSEQIAYGFTKATCRAPSEEEVLHLVALHDEVLESADPQLAMQSVAGVLLNLDEIIMK